MSLSTIKALQDQVEALNTKMGEMAERKNKVVTEPSKEMSKALSVRASNLFLLSRVRGVSADTIDGFEDVKEYATRAMVPADTSDWLAEEFSKDIQERMTLLANVEAMFPKYTIPANVESLSIPQKN